ncbi:MULTISPECIES: hypothetical protein [Acidobacterium]|nr:MULTISPECIES: hypothetical protein [Acidobacterium]
MTLQVIGALIIAGNVIGLILVIFWMGLGMPVHFADFRERFRQTFFRHPHKPAKHH